MSAAELALVVGAVLCALGFAGLVVALLAVVGVLRDLRRSVDSLQAEATPLLAELRASVAEARHDLDRFDRVLGSAEAISGAVEGASRVASGALAAPVIKTVALASGTSQMARRLRRSGR